MGLSEKIQSVMFKDSSNFNTPYLGTTLHDTIEKIEDYSKKSIPIKDHYSNDLRGEGEADPQSSFTNYGYSNDTMNWWLWLALYNDSWVFRRAIDKPSQDEVNCGFTLHGTADYSKVYKAFNKNKADLINLLMWGSLFGGSIAVMLFEGIDDDELSKPLKKNKIKGARFKLYVTDRWYGVGVLDSETVSDMRDVDFGKPKYYNITFADGHATTVHHSYILRYEHRTAPRLIKNGQLQGWGYAEGSHILNELARDDQLKAAIQTLVNKSNIEVIKMAGMRGLFMGADEVTEEQLTKRLEMVQWGRSYNSLTFLDKDDSYEAHPFSGLSGLADILQQNMWMISSALEMQGVLYGDLKGGLSQESDAMDRYAITIKNRCDSYFRPVLYKFLKLMFIVYDVKGPVDFDFNSIQQKKENKDQVDAINTYANTLNTLVSNGIISKYQMARALKDFIEKNVISIQFTQVQLDRLKFEEEMEILGVYKKAGKSAPSLGNDMGSDFGGGGGESFGSDETFGDDEIGGDTEGDVGSSMDEPPADSGGSEGASE